MRHERYRYLMLALLGVVAVVLAALWITERGHAQCEGYWEASSIQYVNGKATEPVVTHGCGRP